MSVLPLSETLRPPLGVPQGDGNASRYNGRDRRFGPLRWEVGRVREYITEECCDRTDRRLSSGTVDCPIHLCEKSNRDRRADNSANRGAEYVLETEGGENISARHYEMRKSSNASRTLTFKLRIDKPFPRGRPFDRAGFSLRYAGEKA